MARQQSTDERAFRRVIKVSVQRRNILLAQLLLDELGKIWSEEESRDSLLPASGEDGDTSTQA